MEKSFITDEIKAAMRAHDKERLSILRLVKNEIDILEKKDQKEASAEEVMAAFKRVLKQTSETLEGSIKVGTDAERTAKLQTQVDILTAYLPAPVEGAQLEALIDRIIAENSFSGKRDMGKAIGLVVSETDGNVDKAAVAKLVGSRLN